MCIVERILYDKLIFCHSQGHHVCCLTSCSHLVTGMLAKLFSRLSAFFLVHFRPPDWWNDRHLLHRDVSIDLVHWMQQDCLLLSVFAAALDVTANWLVLKNGLLFDYLSDTCNRCLHLNHLFSRALFWGQQEILLVAVQWLLAWLFAKLKFY